MPKRIDLLTWNPAHCVWETPRPAICGHLEPFSETWPRWGSMQGGVVSELPMPALPTSVTGCSSLLPTPVADNSRGLPQRGTAYQSLPNVAIALLPTPAVNDMGGNKTVEWWDDWAPRQKASDGRAAPHGKSLSIEVRRTTADADSASGEAWGDTGRDSEQSREEPVGHSAPAVGWGVYAAAIERWEHLTGWPAPAPAIDDRLNPDFAEWMMGWPVGWTDVGLSRTQRLKIIGNGVVPQQASLALQLLQVTT